MRRLSQIILILALIFSALIPLSKVRAQERSWVFDDFADCIKSALTGNQEMCKAGYFASGLNDFWSSFILAGLGAVPDITVPRADFYHNSPYVQQINQRSAMAGFTNLTIAMYTHPPANLALWVDDTAVSLGLKPKTAYAQGIGFTGLSPLLGIWKAFRNIAYFLMAIVMIVIGFMVMLRKNIDPKTVVTVQNALPRIVIALLLITFSYAIAALVIDLMYLILVLVINLIVSSSGKTLGADTASKYLTHGWGTLLAALFNGGYKAWDDLMKMIFYNNGSWWLSLVADIATFSLALAVQMVLVWLILTIALIFGIVRIVFMLMTAYIQIIIAVLTAPLQLLFEAIPGSTAFSSWFKNLIANISVFPITAGMILVGTVLTRSGVDDLWTPPLLTGSQGGKGILGLIGLGVLLTAPTVAGSIKEALKAKPAVSAGPGASLGPLMTGGQTALQLWYQASFVGQTLRHGKPEPSRVGEMIEKQRSN